MNFKLTTLYAIILAVCGCATGVSTQTGRESLKDAESAAASVLGSISGEKVDSQDLKRLSREMQEDEQAQEAVRAISESLSGAERTVKYCPQTGKRYNHTLDVCPVHGVKLKYVEE